MRCCVRVPYFYNICVDLVMCAWYKPEALAVLVVLVILLALFGPGTPVIAVGLGWFWNPHDSVMHGEFVWREK